MIVAINDVKDAPKLKNHEIIYAFNDEPLEYLLKTGLHCVKYDRIEKVHLNLTDYEISCKKKAKITDKDLFELPKVKQNKYVIIIPNYNNEKWLNKCIDSVLNQTYKNFELIIIDDMSTDSSVKTIQSYRNKEEYNNKIHLLQNKRKRYNGGSRNVGIDYALDNIDFDYFCFLDSDDWWKDDYVLEDINDEIADNEMLIIGAEMLYEDGVKYKTFNDYKNYEEFFISDGKKTIWCTAWCRVIKKDKIVHFCEDTLMEDRVWTYKEADIIDFNKVGKLERICYVWNKMNKTSVTTERNEHWNASAWIHIGNCLSFLADIKHKEMIPIIKRRIEICKSKLNEGQYTQF